MFKVQSKGLIINWKRDRVVCFPWQHNVDNTHSDWTRDNDNDFTNKFDNNKPYYHLFFDSTQWITTSPSSLDPKV